MASIRERVENSFLWNSSITFIIQGINLVVGVFLARLLTPNEFGIIAMVLVISGFAVIFMDLGFCAALIQKKEVATTQFSSVFWINNLIGFLFTLCLFFATPWIAQFYEEPLLLAIIPFLSLTFIIKALGMVHKARLEKKMEFKLFSLIRLVAVSGSGALAITLALTGWGIWALVAKVLAVDLFFTILLWYYSKWKPKFHIKGSEIKELFRFSLNLTGVQTFNYWTRKLDDLLIGKYLGSSSLGFYSKAYSFLVLPLLSIKNSVSRIMFPAMSIIQDDRVKLKKAYLKVVEALAFITMPLMLMLYCVAEEFVYLILGEQWIEIIPIMKIFCIAAIPDSLRITGVVFQALNKTDLLFKYSVITKLLFLLFIIIGLQYGLIGVAYGVGLGLLINFIVMQKVAGDQIDLSLWEVINGILPITFNALFMFIVVSCLGALMFGTEVSFFSLFTKIALCALVYLLFNYINRPKITVDLLVFAKRRVIK